MRRKWPTKKAEGAAECRVRTVKPLKTRELQVFKYGVVRFYRVWFIFLGLLPRAGVLGLGEDPEASLRDFGSNRVLGDVGGRPAVAPFGGVT